MKHINLCHTKGFRQIFGRCWVWGYYFVRCGIEEIVLPDQLRIIPPFAFKECKNLRRVVCGAGLEKIYSWAFGGCELLTEENLIHGPGVEISPKAFEFK